MTKSLSADLPEGLKTQFGNVSELGSSLKIGLVGALVTAFTAPFVTPYMSVATVNLFLILIGFSVRRRSRKAHALFMSLGVAGDLILVLVLQFQRQAIQTAASFDLSVLKQAHIFASTTAVTLYLPLVTLGIFLYRQKERTQNIETKRNLHRQLGWAALLFRTVGYFLMFSMLD